MGMVLTLSKLYKVTQYYTQNRGEKVNFRPHKSNLFFLNIIGLIIYMKI